jgi:hypothetical protein
MASRWAWCSALLAVAVATAAACDDEAGTPPGGTPAGGAGGADAGVDAGGAGGAGEGDASDNPELDAKCTPTVTLQMEDDGPKGQIFTDAVPEPEAFVQETGRMVCRILYREPDEVRDANHITLIIRDDPEYPGWKMGDVGNITVMISTDHLAQVQADGRDVETEIRGILLHEMTHMYQHDDKAPGEGTYPNMENVLEGVADFVRIRAGFRPHNAVASKSGTWDDVGYWKPAFFMLWIDLQYPDFLYQLNLTMMPGDYVAWTPDTFEDITGVSVDDHWALYLDATCCAGLTQTCCY